MRIISSFITGIFIGFVAVSLILAGAKRLETTFSANADNTGVAAPAPVVPTPAPSVAPEGVKNIKYIKMSNPARVLTLFDEVAGNALELARKISDLNTASEKEPIYLLIDSPGGSVFSGSLLISAIEASKAPVYTVCVGWCASMGAIIHQFGKQRYMVDRAMLMFHQASGGVQGPLEQMDSQLQTIKRSVYKLDARIAQRAGVSFDKFITLNANQIWKDAEDCTNEHYNDSLVSLTYGAHDNVPGALPQNRSTTPDEFKFLQDLK